MITFRYIPRHHPLDADLKKAFEACEHENFSHAYLLFQKAAERGSHQAQTCLAIMMINGTGISQNAKMGIAMLEMLAHTHVAEAQSVLGELFYCGFYVPMDEMKACQLFESAARIEDPDALFFLGQIYGRGEGVKPDLRKAIAFLERAHKAGHPTAFIYQASLTILEDVSEDKIRESLNLLMHEAEDGSAFAAYLLYEHYDKGTHFVRQDTLTASRWLESAAALGYSRALFELGHLYLESEQYDKALFYLEQAAQKDHLGALHTLGVLYKRDDIIQQNAQKACQYLEKAAHQGHALAKYSLGHYYYYLDPPEFEKAYTWLSLAAEQSEPNAFFLLAQMTEMGEHVPKDLDLALTYYEKAAHLGDAQAHFRLAKLLLWSDTSPLEEARQKGFHHLEKAAYLGFDQALLSLGIEYGEGHLVPLDRKKALSLLTQAVDKNVDDAFSQLTYLLDNERFLTEQECLPLDELEHQAQTNPNAQYLLANKYKWENGVPLDYDKAFQLFSMAASQGHLPSWNALGYFYHHGLGCTQDFQEMFACHETAALGGYIMAMRHLGWCYETGTGCDQDLTQAFYWYEKACAQGDVRAYADVGRFYEFGNGLDEDATRAFSCYEKGASFGDGPCTFFLGMAFEEGMGTPCDEEKAFTYYTKALPYQIPGAFVRLGGLYENGTGVEKDLQKAFELYKTAAEDFDDPVAEYNLAYAYHHGWGVSPDLSLAHQWYEKAASQDHAASQLALGELFFYGHLGEPDYEKAAFWYDKAALSDNAAAQYSLAHLYAEGLGVKQDVEKAFRFAKAAADNADTSALALLGLMYEEGSGTKKNQTEALRLYELSAAQGDPLGLYYLGRFYDQQQHYSQAIKWYEAAAAKKQAEALERLGFFYLFGVGVSKDDTQGFSYYLQAAEAGSPASQRLIAHLFLKGKGTPRNIDQAQYWMDQSLQSTQGFLGVLHRFRFKSALVFQNIFNKKN